jgi:hypothetical protein
MAKLLGEIGKTSLKIRSCTGIEEFKQELVSDEILRHMLMQTFFGKDAPG